jgi:hypothetical protein
MASVRPGRRQFLPVLGIVLLVLFTLGNAAANMLPSRRPTKAEVQRAERAELVEQRRARIAQLAQAGTTCHAPSAHELARLLVMDGRGADAATFADAYEARCGADPVVRHWGDAPRPKTSVLR